MLTEGASPSQNPASCCCKPHSHTTSLSIFDAEKSIWLLEKISAVALGIFSAVVAPLHFSISFTAGFILGLLSDNQSAAEGTPGYAVTSCSRGFLEGITGVRLPPVVSLIANAAVLASHIEHVGYVFVPLTSVILGQWAGNAAQPAANLFFRNIVNIAELPAA